MNCKCTRRTKSKKVFVPAKVATGAFPSSAAHDPDYILNQLSSSVHNDIVINSNRRLLFYWRLCNRLSKISTFAIHLYGMVVNGGRCLFIFSKWCWRFKFQRQFLHSGIICKIWLMTSSFLFSSNLLPTRMETTKLFWAYIIFERIYSNFELLFH